MHVVFAAGGTAGHLEPALNTADALMRIAPATSISFVGGSRGLETHLVPQRGYALIQTGADPFPRRMNRAALGFPAHTVGSVRAASAHLRASRAGVVVGFGGYAAVPGYLAAWRSELPCRICQSPRRAPHAAHWSRPRRCPSSCSAHGAAAASGDCSFGPACPSCSGARPLGTSCRSAGSPGLRRQSGCEAPE